MLEIKKDFWSKELYQLCLPHPLFDDISDRIQCYAFSGFLLKPSSLMVSPRVCLVDGVSITTPSQLTKDMFFHVDDYPLLPRYFQIAESEDEAFPLLKVFTLPKQRIQVSIGSATEIFPAQKILQIRSELCPSNCLYLAYGEEGRLFTAMADLDSLSLCLYPGGFKSSCVSLKPAHARLLMALIGVFLLQQSLYSGEFL